MIEREGHSCTMDTLLLLFFNISIAWNIIYHNAAKIQTNTICPDILYIKAFGVYSMLSTHFLNKFHKVKIRFVKTYFPGQVHNS